MFVDIFYDVHILIKGRREENRAALLGIFYFSAWHFIKYFYLLVLKTLCKVTCVTSIFYKEIETMRT